MLDLSRFLERQSEPAALVGPDGETIVLPLEVYRTLTEIVELMKSHRAVAVAPVDQRLTTHEAADFLGIGRPTLIKHIEQGKLPCETVKGSRHRRIALSDLLEYQTRRHNERHQALQEMVQDAEAANLYDISAEEFKLAIRAARTEIAEE